MSLILGILDSGVTGGGGAAGSYESIATVTVGSGGSSSVTFSSIPSTFTHLQIRMINKDTFTGGGAANCTINLNSDTSNSNYSSHDLRGTGSSASSSGSADYRSRAFFMNGASDVGFSLAIIDFLDYGNTNKFKTFKSLSGYDSNGSGIIVLSSVNWRNTNAITTINVVAENTFAQYTQIALYGIKGS
jgi:hypothetical protein